MMDACVVCKRRELEAEIERLRATLREIIGLDHHNHGPASRATGIARAALSPVQQGADDLTDDQVKYLHERADARRKVWADHAAVQDAPTPGFEDPRVQIVYELLCDPTEPPGDEHWEGFVARRIVHSLVQQAPAEVDDPVEFYEQQREGRLKDIPIMCDLALDVAVKEWRDANKGMTALATDSGKSSGIKFRLAIRRYAEAERRLMELAEALGGDKPADVQQAPAYEAMQQESGMTNPTTVFDRALDQFKRDMCWSPQATETEKTLVLGNLNGFTALLNKMLLETSDAEIVAAVSPEDLAEARCIKDAVLER